MGITIAASQEELGVKDTRSLHHRKNTRPRPACIPHNSRSPYIPTGLVVSIPNLQNLSRFFLTNVPLPVREGSEGEKEGMYHRLPVDLHMARMRLSLSSLLF